MEIIKSNLHSFILLLIFTISVSFFVPLLSKDVDLQDTGSISYLPIENKPLLNLSFSDAPSKLCVAYFQSNLDQSSCRNGEVPSGVAFWLFIFALIGFVCFTSKRKI